MNQQGFTLLEVIIAVAIFAIGILAVIGLQVQVVGGNARSNIQTQQQLLAQRVMEQVKNAPDIFNPTGNNNITVLNNVDGEGNAGGPYNVTVTRTNPLGGTTSRFITVTVTKTGGILGHNAVIRCLSHGNGI
jgi:type IV pilus assembly protein PilV